MNLAPGSFRLGHFGQSFRGRADSTQAILLVITEIVG